MANLGKFNANTIETKSDFEVMPVGKYKAIITESANKTTKAGTGSYLKLTFDIIEEGEYFGRKVWTNLNLQNPNIQAVQIAQQELAAICKAVGVLEPTDSEELHSIPLIIKLGIETRDGFEPTNRIKAFLPIEKKNVVLPPAKESSATVSPAWGAVAKAAEVLGGTVQ